jgi:hypothetical protein
VQGDPQLFDGGEALHPEELFLEGDGREPGK